MKLKFFYPDGKPSLIPTSRDDAIKYRTNSYDSQVPCAKCGHTVRYTANEECKQCAIEASDLQYTIAVGIQGEPGSKEDAIKHGVNMYFTVLPCKTHGHRGLVTLDGKCVECSESYRPREDAIKAGVAFYLPFDKCPKCGKFALRTVYGNYCLGCYPESRKEAVEQGEKLYMTKHPCKHCGSHAPRKVANGNCLYCYRKKKNAPDIEIELGPDFIISRSDAMALGFPKYRTGEECQHGHSGWRYVKGRACCDCMRPYGDGGKGIRGKMGLGKKGITQKEG